MQKQRFGLVVFMVRAQQAIPVTDSLPERGIAGLAHRGFRPDARISTDVDLYDLAVDAEAFASAATVIREPAGIRLGAVIDVDGVDGFAAIDLKQGVQKHRRVKAATEGNDPAARRVLAHKLGESLLKDLGGECFHRLRG